MYCICIFIYTLVVILLEAIRKAKRIKIFHGIEDVINTELQFFSNA